MLRSGLLLYNSPLNDGKLHSKINRRTKIIFILHHDDIPDGKQGTRTRYKGSETAKNSATGF